MEPEVKGKWGSAGANAGRRTWRSGGQIEHERRSWGLTGVALELITAPVYVAAAAAQLAGRPLTHVVTAKGSAATGDSVRTFRAHLGWAGLAAGSVLAGGALSHSYPSLYFWAAVTLLVTLTPVVLPLSDKLNKRVPRLAPALPRRYPVVAHRRIGLVLIRQGYPPGRAVACSDAPREGGPTPPLGSLVGDACRAEDGHANQTSPEEASDMFSTKIRTIIIGLVASTGFAVAAAVPAASQAQWHNYCIAGHCTTHANYTINDPCTSGTAAAASTTEAQKAEEEQKKKEEEEKEGQVHQGEIEKSFYGCDAETPPTSGGSSGGTSTGTTTVSPVRILTAPVVLPAL